MFCGFSANRTLKNALYLQKKKMDQSDGHMEKMGANTSLIPHVKN
jgi:hypothetical protein